MIVAAAPMPDSETSGDSTEKAHQSSLHQGAGAQVAQAKGREPWFAVGFF
jgi:hypothetical protein